MQHEILVAMLGHHGSIIGPPISVDNKSQSTKYIAENLRFECLPLARSLLSQSEIEAINRVVKYGGYIAFINKFIKEKSTFMGGTNKTKSLYFRAISSAIQDIVHSYEQSICFLEESLIENPTLGVGYIHSDMNSKTRWIPWVTKLILSIEKVLYDENYDMHSEYVSISKTILETLHTHINACADENVRYILQRIENSW